MPKHIEIDAEQYDLQVAELCELRAKVAAMESRMATAVRSLKYLGRFRYNDYDEPNPLDCTLAGRVMRVFGMGMTRASELCEVAGEDPHFSESDERRNNLTARRRAES